MGCVSGFFNMMLFGASLYILITGIVKQSDSPDGYSSFYHIKYYTSPSIVIAIGSVMSLITGFGLFAVMCQSEFCTKPYKRCMVAALILIMAGGIAGYLCKDNALHDLLDHFQSTMRAYGKNDAIRNSWDVMQYNEHCCGTYGYNDWKNISLIPNSCCKEYFLVGRNCTYENTFKKGCFIAMKRIVDANAIFILVPAIVISCLEVIQIIYPYRRSETPTTYNYI